MDIKWILFLLLIGSKTSGQTNDSLLVSINKFRGHENLTFYEVTIKNNSGTPVCILHSVFVDLNDQSPQNLATYTKNKKTEFYKLFYSAKDTTFNFERVLYDGEFIMPHQSINFKISIPLSLLQKTLNFEYIYFSDFCYKKLINEMNKTATWYLRYQRLNRSIELPNK